MGSCAIEAYEREEEIFHSPQAEECDDASVRWQSGDKIHPVPLDIATADILFGSEEWVVLTHDVLSQKRAVRHEVLNRPLAFRQMDGTLAGFRTFDDTKTNTRSAAMATVEGLFDIEGERFFCDGMRLTKERDVEGMPPVARAKAAKSLRVDKYAWDYRYRVQADHHDQPIPGAQWWHPADRVSGPNRLVNCEAYCVLKCVELLYAKPTPAEVAANPDTRRGAVIGTRLHVLTFNPHFSRMELLKRFFEHRASLRGKNARSPSSDPDVHTSGVVKHMNVLYDSEVTEAAVLASGVPGGCVRTPLVYANTGQALRDGRHSPSVLFNARHGSDPPSNLFPNAPRREWGDARPYNPALEAFMVSPEGLPLDVCDDQVNPNNYFDADGMITFPFMASVRFLRPTDAFLTASFPFELPRSVPPGRDALFAYYTVMKQTDDEFQRLRKEVLNSIVVDLKGEEPGSDRPTFGDMHYAITAHLDPVPRGDCGAELDRLRKLLLHARTPGAHAPPIPPPTPAGDSVPVKIEFATSKLQPRIEAAYRACLEARRIRNDNKEPRAEVEREFLRSVNQVMEWGVSLFFETYADDSLRPSLAPCATSIWRSFASIRRALPGHATHARVDASDGRSREGSINYAFMFGSTRERPGLSVFGEWSTKLATLYSKHLNISGDALQDRLAIHTAAFQPACHAMGLDTNPALVIEGPAGVGKSHCIARMGALFNAIYDNRFSRNWFQSTPSLAAPGGNIATWAGGVKMASGEVRCLTKRCPDECDTAEIADQQDALKRLLTTGETWHRKNGLESRWEFGLDTSTIMAVVNGKTAHARPSVPTASPVSSAMALDEARRDSIRSNIQHVFVTAPTQHTTWSSTQSWIADMQKASALKDCLLHTLVSTLTYIVVEMVSNVPWWRAANAEDAERMWTQMDVKLQRDYKFQPPNERRRKLRTMQGLILACERAVVTYLCFKEEAVAFAGMQPRSSPFAADATEFVHTLAPYSHAQIASILKLVVFDEELVLAVYTMGLAVNPATSTKMFNALRAIVETNHATTITPHELPCDAMGTADPIQSNLVSAVRLVSDVDRCIASLPGMGVTIDPASSCETARTLNDWETNERILHFMRDLKGAGRTSASPSDVETCTRLLAKKNGKKVDALHIHIAKLLCAQLPRASAQWIDRVTQAFAAVYPSRAAVNAALPETTIRFTPHTDSGTLLSIPGVSDCVDTDMRQKSVDKCAERGVAAKGSAFAHASMDCGLGLLATARVHLATNVEASSAFKWLNSEAAYLRPYHPAQGRGTSKEHDELRVAAFINNQLTRSHTGGTDAEDSEDGDIWTHDSEAIDPMMWS